MGGMHNRGVFAAAALCAALLWPACGLCAAEPSAEDREFFETRVRPVLVDVCQKCHAEAKQEAGLRLDAAQLIRRGSENGR